MGKAMRTMVQQPVVPVTTSTPQPTVLHNVTGAIELVIPAGKPTKFLREQTAAKIAALLTDNEFTDDVDKTVKAKEIGKFAPVKLLFNDLYRLIGAEKLSSFPVPGSVEKAQGGNETMADIITITENDKKTDVSFYTMIAKLHPFGRQVADEIKDYEAAFADTPGGPYVNLGKNAAKAERDKMKARLKGFADVLSDAVAVHLKLDEINGHAHYSKSVTAQFVTHEVNNTGQRAYEGIVAFDAKQAEGPNNLRIIRVPRDTTKPIEIIDKESPSNSRAVSVGTFLSYDLEKAMKEGGKYLDLVSSGKTKRGPTPTGKDGEEEKISVSNMGTAITAFHLLAGWMEKADNNKKFLTALNKKEPDQETKDTWTSAGRLFWTLKPIFDNPTAMAKFKTFADSEET